MVRNPIPYPAWVCMRCVIAAGIADCKTNTFIFNFYQCVCVEVTNRLTTSIYIVQYTSIHVSLWRMRVWLYGRACDVHRFNRGQLPIINREDDKWINNRSHRNWPKEPRLKMKRWKGKVPRNNRRSAIFTRTRWPHQSADLSPTGMQQNCAQCDNLHSTLSYWMHTTFYTRVNFCICIGTVHLFEKYETILYTYICGQYTRIWMCTAHISTLNRLSRLQIVKISYRTCTRVPCGARRTAYITSSTSLLCYCWLCDKVAFRPHNSTIVHIHQLAKHAARRCLSMKWPHVFFSFACYESEHIVYILLQMRTWWFNMPFCYILFWLFGKLYHCEEGDQRFICKVLNASQLHL